MRVVLDSNVIISAFAAKGLCDSVFQSCLASHELFLSVPMLGEIEANLTQKMRISSGRVREIIAFLRSELTFVEPLAVPADACRDQGDLIVLGTTVAASAAYLVTGDRDLLILRYFRGTDILSPREFHTRFHET